MATKILVVDDDVDSLKLIGLMLQRQGYEVAGASSGSQAIEKAIAEQPNLIILDVMMPDMDGYTVSRQLRSDARTREIPIIMFTAKTLIDDKVAGFEAGADDYLTKPTHPAELASRVKAVLARSIAARRGTGGNQGITYAFLGTKGGVGTSTLAVNVGAMLADQENTALVDFRLGQGSIGLSMGLGHTSGLANVLSHPPAEITPQNIEPELITHSSGLRLLLSSARPRENQLNVSQDAALAILRALRTLSKNLLIDLGAGLNRLSARVIREVNQLILTVEPNRVSLALAHNLLQEIQQIGLSESAISVVIINRSSVNAQIPWQEAERLLGVPVAALISPVPELAFQAIEAGVPIVRLQPEAVVVSQFNKLVEELAKRTRSS